MTVGMPDDTQRTAARVVGAAYLVALVPAVFAEFYVRGQLVVAGNAAQTALNIVAHERLFRLGTAGNLAVSAIDIALITALYLVLNPINRSLALLALGWGLVETIVLVVATLSDFNVLRILSGAAYPSVFELDRLQTLARLSVGTHADVYNVGLVFAGLRSSTFCCLWFHVGPHSETTRRLRSGRVPLDGSVRIRVRHLFGATGDCSNRRVAGVQGTATVGAIGGDWPTLVSSAHKV
jgi:hypothetical protein